MATKEKNIAQNMCSKFASFYQKCGTKLSTMVNYEATFYSLAYNGIQRCKEKKMLHFTFPSSFSADSVDESFL